MKLKNRDKAILSEKYERCENSHSEKERKKRRPRPNEEREKKTGSAAMSG